MRLVQRRERHERCQSVQHVGVDANRERIARAAVDDAMTDRDEISIPHVRLQPIEEELQGAGMLRRGIFLPRVFADGRTARIFRVKASPAIKLLQVATDTHLESVTVAHQKLGELEARGARIQNEDRVAHIIPALLNSAAPN